MCSSCSKYSGAPQERTLCKGMAACSAYNVQSHDGFCSYFYIGNRAASPVKGSPSVCALVKSNFVINLVFNFVFDFMFDFMFNFVFTWCS